MGRDKLTGELFCCELGAWIVELTKGFGHRYPFLALSMATGLALILVRPLVFICQVRLLLLGLAHIAHLDLLDALSL